MLKVSGTSDGSPSPTGVLPSPQNGTPTHEGHRCIGALRSRGGVKQLWLGITSCREPHDFEGVTRDFDYSTIWSSCNGACRVSRDVGRHGHRFKDLRLPIFLVAHACIRRGPIGSRSRTSKESGGRYRHERRAFTSPSDHSRCTNCDSNAGDNHGLCERRTLARIQSYRRSLQQHSRGSSCNNGNRREGPRRLDGSGVESAGRWYLLTVPLLGWFTLAFSLTVSSPAYADGGFTSVECGTVGSPSCMLSAVTTGQAAESANSSPQTVQQVSASSAGGGECQAPSDLGKMVPCNSPSFGWLGSTGCYYKADPTFAPPVWDTADQHPAGEAGSYYEVTCSAQNFNTGGGIVWLPSGAAVAMAPVLPNPAVLAQQAVRQLSLPSLSINTSPSTGSDQLVGLPTWLWLETGSWHPITATAAVPGESVTATATPTSVTWNLGDGNTIECQGPGTPYAATDSPGEASPNCGHTYTDTSAGQPNNAYTVTATVSWAVDWAGGGQAGTVPALKSTTTTPLRVADVESLNATPEAA